ncbi:MAG: hypothetical protein ACRDL3_07670 [Solirubrobacterales bacterium]
MGRRLVRFNTALNAADSETLRRFWVERNDFRRDRGPFAKGSFRWFSITNSPSPGHKHHFVGFQPRRAIRYVRERRGFRLQLSEVDVGSGRGLDHGLGIRGRWVLDDGTSYEVLGKGVMRCRTGWIKVLSMAVQPFGEESGIDPCRDPPGGAETGTLVVCAPDGRDRVRAPQPDPTPTSFVVTRDDPRLIDTCQPERLGRRLLKFNRALNIPDLEALRRYWRSIKAVSIKNGFAVGHAERFKTFSRKRALKYVRRHGGLRLQLNEARLIEGFGTVQAVRLQGRWISEDGAELPVSGNTGVGCRSSAIQGLILRLGDPGGPIPGRDLCPDPPSGPPEPGVLVICATPEQPGP